MRAISEGHYWAMLVCCICRRNLCRKFSPVTRTYPVCLKCSRFHFDLVYGRFLTGYWCVHRRGHKYESSPVHSIVDTVLIVILIQRVNPPLFISLPERALYLTLISSQHYTHPVKMHFTANRQPLSNIIGQSPVEKETSTKLKSQGWKNTTDLGQDNVQNKLHSRT